MLISFRFNLATIKLLSVLKGKDWWQILLYRLKLVRLTDCIYQYTSVYRIKEPENIVNMFILSHTTFIHHATASIVEKYIKPNAQFNVFFLSITIKWALNATLVPIDHTIHIIHDNTICLVLRYINITRKLHWTFLLEMEYRNITYRMYNIYMQLLEEYIYRYFIYNLIFPI